MYVVWGVRLCVCPCACESVVCVGVVYGVCIGGGGACVRCVCKVWCVVCMFNVCVCGVCVGGVQRGDNS